MKKYKFDSKFGSLGDIYNTKKEKNKVFTVNH